MRLRWREFLIAFFMAVVLWYGVSGSEKLESQVDVRVDYRGLPQGLVVKSGMVNKVSVRVRASAGMLRSIANRDFAFNLDLSDVHKGENTLAVNLAYLPFRSGVEVIDVTPSRVFLDVDTISQKLLPLDAQIMAELPQDYVAHVTFTPREVTVSGPSADLAAMESVLVQVPIEFPDEVGETVLTRILPLPDGMDATPSEVRVSVNIGVNRRTVSLTRPIRVEVPTGFGSFMRPDSVTLEVAMPASLAAKAASNPEITARVHLAQHDLGSYTLPVEVTLPKGAELVKVSPEQVTLTLEQR